VRSTKSKQIEHILFVSTLKLKNSSFDIVGVLATKSNVASTKSNVASKLLLVWMRLYSVALLADCSLNG